MHKEIPITTTRRRQFETIDFETEHDCEIKVTKFTDIACKRLEDDVRK